MPSRMNLRIAWFCIAVLFSASTYCALWALSSSDLAFLPCGGKFSLFAPTFRCSQPYVAAILCLFLFASSAVGMVLVVRQKRTHLDRASQSRR